MIKNKRAIMLVALMVLATNALTNKMLACTDVVLHKTKGIVVSGRTLDFTIELGGDIIAKKSGTLVEDKFIHLVNTKTFNTKLANTELGHTQTVNSKSLPFSWTSKYNVLLVGICNTACYPEGLNSQGLSVSTLWHNGSEPAQIVQPGTRAISVPAITEYILENAKTVDETKMLMDAFSIFPLFDPKHQLKVQNHWIVTDKTGRSVVIELKNGKPKFFEQASQINVLTNQPCYDEQLTHLAKFSYLKAKNNKNDVIAGCIVNGSGALGMPGDYTPASRFVKTAFLAKYVAPLKSGQDGINTVFHILHNVDIPRGAIAEGDYTQWTSARDHQNLTFWFASYNHPAIKFIDLNKIDFDKVAGRHMSIDYDGNGDVTAQFMQ